MAAAVTPDAPVTSNPADPSRTADEIINTVYIYSRAGLNRPPIAHLPGHKKPSIAVKCSPIFYTLRSAAKSTTQITIDTSSADDAIAALPEPVISTKSTTYSAMDPPPTTIPSPSEAARPTSSPRNQESDPMQAAAASAAAVASAPSAPVFALPYRIIYAVATQDAVLVYDTQQQTPIINVSNLHYATFTDLTWWVQCNHPMT